MLTVSAGSKIGFCCSVLVVECDWYNVSRCRQLVPALPSCRHGLVTERPLHVVCNARRRYCVRGCAMYASASAVPGCLYHFTSIGNTGQADPRTELLPAGRQLLEQLLVTG
jgi:hypothetical protein